MSSGPLIKHSGAGGTGGDSQKFIRFVGQLQLVLLLACGLALLGALFSHEQLGLRVAGILAFALIIVVSRWALRAGPHAGVKFLTVGIWSANSIFICMFGGVHSANVVVYPLLAAICGWVLGTRWLIALVTCTIIFLLGAAGAEMTEVLTPSPRAAPLLVAAISVAVMVCVVFLTRALYLDAQANRESLVDLNRTLEQRVDDRTNALREAMLQLKQSQEGLARSERLAALGALVAGVSHELNTPIGNSVTAASTMLDIASDLQEHGDAQTLKRSHLMAGLGRLEQGSALVLRNLNRAAHLIQSFKQVSVDQTSEERRSFDLAKVVGDVLDSMAPTLRRHPHSVSRAIAADLQLDSYPGPLGQVIINLIQNAYQHAFDETSAGGTVHITASSCEAKTGHNGVLITVSDDGLGIPPENMGRIFEPFFTTRMARGGTGLGLSIVYNIVHDILGGTIDVRSRSGEGARFEIWLPNVAPKQANDAIKHLNVQSDSSLAPA